MWWRSALRSRSSAALYTHLLICSESRDYRESAAQRQKRAPRCRSAAMRSRCGGATRERNFEEHQRLIFRHEHRVWHIQARSGNERHLVIHVEEYEAVNGSLRRDNIRIKRERREYFRELIHLLVFAGIGNANGNARQRWGRRAGGMRDRRGYFARRERIHVLVSAIVKLHLKLNRLQLDANDLARIVPQKHLDGQNSSREGIGLAEFIFRARGIRIGVRGDG